MYIDESRIYCCWLLIDWSFLLSAFYVCIFLLFLLSPNIFNICFQWFMLYTTSCRVFYFLKFCFTIEHMLCCIFFSANCRHCICYFWVDLFYIPHVQSNFQYIFYVICVTFLYVFFHLPFVLLYSSWKYFYPTGREVESYFTFIKTWIWI